MAGMKVNAGLEPMGRDEEVRGSSDRSFGFVFAAVFMVIGLAPLARGGEIRIWSLAVAVAFLLVSLIHPPVLAPLNRLWTKVGLLLHKVTNPVIMGAVFFLAVTPTAFVMKACGKDPLLRKFDPAARSYWIDRTPPGPEPDTMKNQF